MACAMCSCGHGQEEFPGREGARQGGDILTAWEMAVPVDQRLLREKKETLIVAAEKQAPPSLENLCLNYEVLKPLALLKQSCARLSAFPIDAYFGLAYQ